MHVGIYFSASHLGTWTWEEFATGRLGTSGTDAAQLHLIRYLAKQPDITLLVMSDCRIPEREGMRQTMCDEFSEAVRAADQYEVDALIYISRDQALIKKGIVDASQRGLSLLAWAQNHPSPWMLDVLAEEPSVKRLICVSKSEADDLRHHPVFDNVEVIYNGIDPVPFERATETTERNRRQVCFLGALTPSKGFHHVARAWSDVRAAVPDAMLHVMGSAKLYDRGQRLGPLGIAEANYEQSEIIPHLGASRDEARAQGVYFRGLVPHSEVRTTIASSLVGIVNPIVSGSIETFCVSAVEIQAGGAAVIGGRSCGLRETVQHGRTGHLVRDVTNLAASIRKLLAFPDRALSMGEYGQQRVREKFGLDRFYSRWHEILRNVEHDRGAIPPNFSWQRATWKTTLRELIRLSGSRALLSRRINSG